MFKTFLKSEKKRSRGDIFHTDVIVCVIMSRTHSPAPAPDIIHPAHSTKKVGYVSHMRQFYGFQQLVSMIIGFPVKFRIVGYAHWRQVELSIASKK